MIGGPNPDETVVLKLKCKYDGSSGDLVVTDKSVTFFRSKGFLGSEAKRMHTIRFGDVRQLRIEAAFLGVELVIDTAAQVYRYTCSQGEAESVIRAVTQLKAKAPSRSPEGQPFVMEAQPAVRETVREVVLVVCPNCGQRNDSSKRKCGNCGASI